MPAEAAIAVDQSPDAATDLEVALRRLVAGLPAGRRLPPERALAEQFGASRPRVRAVLARLQQEGRVEARQGSGTFVSADTTGTAPLRRVSLVIDAALKLGDDPLFSLLLERLQAACAEAGAGCVLSRYRPGDPLPPAEDGQLTLGLDAGQAALAAASARRGRAAYPPLVALLVPADARPTRGASVLQLDDFGAGADAARHLLAQGCNRILFFGRDSVPASRERAAGAASVCTAAGIPLTASPCALNYAAGLAAGRALSVPAGSGTESVGLLAANDWLAVGLRAGLASRGADFPLAHAPLVSFDGLPLAADLALGIESFAIPLYDLARDALAELARLRNGAGVVGRAIRYGLSS